LGADPSEIVFTSGGSESNNLAIRGSADLSRPAHAVTSTIEHPSVLEVFRLLEREGLEVTFIPPGADGVAKARDFEQALRPDTVLVSLMAANNETGAVQPLAEVAQLVEARRAAGQKILLHSDGVQAVGKMDVHLHGLGIDLFSFSGHKVYAPKGIGALFVRRGVKLQSQILGGRQERSLRAGTENVPAAVALAEALQLCTDEERARLADLRDEFERLVLSKVPGAQVNGSNALRLPNTSNIFLPGLSGEALLIALDMRGMCVSTGSACSSGSIEPSHVLLEMGLTAKEARSCVRFSFGRENTREEMLCLVAAIEHTAQKQASHSRDKDAQLV
jgi:cysteine desulfurase